MKASDPSNSDTDPARTGLRGRQKAMRRQTILHCAEQLFARDGIDATTIAAIAEAADVSPPTVFNYFGSKENILSALVFEGTEKARSDSFDPYLLTEVPFSQVIGGLMIGLTDKTMAIAGKRIWRYAEAANIRRVGTDFQKRFDRVDRALRVLIVSFLDAYDITLLNAAEPDTNLLANLIFDRWTAHYFEYIKEDDMTKTTHCEQLRADARALVDLIFAPDFARRSPLKPRVAAE